MYFAGTNDSNAEVIGFFINQATINGWYLFKGPEKMRNNVDGVSVILHKDDVGSLFVRSYDREQLNQLVQEERYPTNYSTIFQIRLQAKHLE